MSSEKIVTLALNPHPCATAGACAATPLRS
jgi:hypothetical protein